MKAARLGKPAALPSIETQKAASFLEAAFAGRNAGSVQESLGTLTHCPERAEDSTASQTY